MLRGLLAATAALLFILILVGRFRRGTSPAEGERLPVGGSDSQADSLSPPAALAAPPRGLDPATRETARLQLQGEPDRHFLDSLVFGRDSLLRRWSTDGGWITLVVIPGEFPGGAEEREREIDRAIEPWNLAGLGLRLAPGTDTAGGALIVRWVERFEGERTGRTELTWDAEGAIRWARVTLAFQDQRGRPLQSGERHAVAVHEIGHALGLPHSALPSDVMFPAPALQEPSPRDLYTLRLLYQLPAGWIGQGGPLNGVGS